MLINLHIFFFAEPSSLSINYHSVLHIQPSPSSSHLDFNAASFFANTDTSHVWSLFKFPLTLTKQVHLLEESLTSHPMFRKEFIQKFSALDYLTTHKSKFIFANTVTDALFDRELLTHFSWTGCSIMRLGKKYPFRFLTSILRAVHEIVSSRTANYTQAVNVNFFKVNILKCSKYRLKQRWILF